MYSSTRGSGSNDIARHAPSPDGPAASANGLPSESRHTAHRSPGWMTEPPRSRTRWSAAGRSATGEVRKRRGVAGARPASVEPEAEAVGLGLPSRPRVSGPRGEVDPEHAVPELAGALGVVGGELDQWRGHAREYGRSPRSPAL